MPLYKTPSGVEVQTTEEVARSAGYAPAEQPKKKAPAKKSASSKSDD